MKKKKKMKNALDKEKKTDTWPLLCDILSYDFVLIKAPVNDALKNVDVIRYDGHVFLYLSKLFVKKKKKNRTYTHVCRCILIMVRRCV